jgi:putative ABC transport system permease protein
VLLGDASFTLSRIIVVEPDRGAGFMSFAPRVMINAADLPATGLVQPASRLNYRLAVAGDDASVAQFTRWAEAEMTQPGVRGMRLESLQGGRPEMQQTLARAEKFLAWRWATRCTTPLCCCWRDWSKPACRHRAWRR